MPKSNLEYLWIGVVSVFLGVVAFVFNQSIFDLFFVAVVVFVLWDYTGKVKRLEEKLSAVEARLSVNSSSSS